MDQDKFRKIVREELDQVNRTVINSPDDWKTAKPKIEKFIKEVDKAAEVFESENAPKKGK